MKLTILFIIAGCIPLALVPVAAIGTENYYHQREPYFGSPIWSPNHVLRTRSDLFGKGYFGASRNGNRTHQGIDFISPVSYPVFASKSGRARVAIDKKGYGHYVEIIHPNGDLRTRYAHLLRSSVSDGAWVKKGQEIGKIGKSGNAGNPKMIAHLHFEIRDRNKAINPSRGSLDPRLSIQ